MRKKSYLVQFLLTVLVGPIGLFYSSVGAGLFFTLGTLLSIFLMGPLVLFVILVAWPAAILVGLITVRNHNEDSESSVRDYRQSYFAAQREAEQRAELEK